jgi:multiple sugar transport system substrate-binding protein
MKRTGRRLIITVCLVSILACLPAMLWAAQDPLRIGWWGSQARHNRTLAVLDMYTKKTGVIFDPEFYNFNDYFTKLNAQIAAAEAPDIMQMGGNFVTYMDQIELLNNYIDKKIIDTSNTDKSFLAITSLEGNVYGISNGTNAQAMAYDPALFKKAGVPLPGAKWTWLDYENAAMTITKKLGIMGSSQLDEFIVLTSFVQQYNTGESFFLSPYRVKLNYKTDQYVAEFFAMKYRLTKAKAYPNPAQMAEIKDIEQDPFVRGEAAMTWISTNQFVAISAAAKRALALTNSPRRMANGPLAQGIISSQMMCLYKRSKQKEAAAKFIGYFANDIEANKVLLGERGVPIMKTVRDALSEGLNPELKTVYAYLTQLGKEASMEIQLDSPVQQEIKDAYKMLSEQVVFDKITATVAATQLHRQAQDILNRYNSTKK